MRKERFEVPAAKRRNPYALEARMRTGAGFHGHPAREESRNACRNKNWNYDPSSEDSSEDLDWWFEEDCHAG